MAKWKNINNQIKEAQQEENKIQSKRENVQRKTKEADNKLNIIGKNIFIGARCFAASESSFENSHSHESLCISWPTALDDLRVYP